MEKILLFKTIMDIDHEDIPKNNLFGFEISGNQISIFSTRGALPHIHMIGHAVKNSGLLEMYSRKHPMNITHNTGQTGHAYYSLYYFPIYDCRRHHREIFNAIGVKKKACDFEINSSGKIAPEMVGKKFYINDFIDLVVKGMKDFNIEYGFTISEIELKEQSMEFKYKEHICWDYNELVNGIDNPIVFYAVNEKNAENIKKEIIKQLNKNGKITVNGAYLCTHASILGCYYEFQLPYNRYGWDDPNVNITIQEKSENAWMVILPPPTCLNKIEREN